MKKSSKKALSANPASIAPWTFLSNHAHVLWCIFRNAEMRIRDVAEAVGVTERMVQKIVADLAAAGYITIEKQGRRNSYHLHLDRPLRHSLESHCQVGELLNLMARAGARRGDGSGGSS
jgi:DNA-binding IclR family transcriptional regulator